MMVRNSFIRSMAGRFIALLVFSLLVSGCVSASNKQFNLSQDSLKVGDYNSAFDHAAQSLEHEIDNKKTQAVFPNLSKAAFDYHLGQAKQNELNSQWDQTVQHYESIVSMQGRIEAIQVRLKSYIALEKKIRAREMDRIQAILVITSPDVIDANRDAKNAAAAGHYKRALSHAKAKQYRDAVAEFNNTNKFVSCYKDACTLSHKYRQLADQADALRYYKQGLTEAEAGHYRLAANAFVQTVTFVSNYKDSQRLLGHYSRLANEEDASNHYNRALRHIDQDEFSIAAAEFSKADQFIPGFRDALQQARWASDAVPPDMYRVKELVIHEIQDHGMQPHWYGNYTRKDFVSMKLGHVIVKQGHFKRHRGVWAYPVYIEMSGVIKGHDGVPHPLATAVTERFTLYRNEHRQWEAEFRHQ